MKEQIKMQYTQRVLPANEQWLWTHSSAAKMLLKALAKVLMGGSDAILEPTEPIDLLNQLEKER